MPYRDMPQHTRSLLPSFFHFTCFTEAGHGHHNGPWRRACGFCCTCGAGWDEQFNSLHWNKSTISKNEKHCSLNHVNKHVYGQTTGNTRNIVFRCVLLPKIPLDVWTRGVKHESLGGVDGVQNCRSCRKVCYFYS